MSCADCRVTTYSAALWSGTDECPKCGGRLSVPRRGEPRITRDEPAAAAEAITPAVPPAT